MSEHKDTNQGWKSFCVLEFCGVTGERNVWGLDFRPRTNLLWYQDWCSHARKRGNETKA